MKRQNRLNPVQPIPALFDGLHHYKDGHLRKTWMSELITHVFSLRPIRCNLLSLPSPHFKDASGERLQKKNVRRYRLVSAPPRSPSQAPSASLQLFVLKLALLTSKRFLMSFSSSLYLASLLSSSAALALPLCFLLCLCYPSSLSSPALASSCLLPLQAGFNRGA